MIKRGNLGFGERLAASVTAGGTLWISRTLLGLLVSYPLLAVVQATGMASGPPGDAGLFQPGSLLFLELLRVGGDPLGAAFKVMLLLSGLGLLAQLVFLAMALDLLAEGGSPLRERLGRALGLFPKFMALAAITLLAQAALLLGASLLGALLKSALHGSEARIRDVLPLAAMGLGVLLCAWLGSVQDVARALLVQEEQSAREALARALRCFYEQPLAVIFGAYPSVAGATLAYVVAACVTTRFDLTSASRLAIAGAFFAHQLAVLIAIACRVRWLRTALSLANNQTGSTLR